MSVDRRFRLVMALAVVGLVCAGSAAVALAQTTSASVTGVVQDTQGGVLPGVTVTLTSRTQGNVLTAVTDTDGRFIFAIVRPDAYSLQVALEGFKTLERTNLVVSANERLSAGTLTLEVGQMTEEVTVTSRVSELQITSGERSFTLESEALKNIANNGRSLFSFATLVPGVVGQDTSGIAASSVSGFTVNGQRPNSNNVTIDGVANIDTGDNGGNMATTNIDAVAEFTILTNAYQAEYGRAVGGQVQVVTKSGSQAFHGSGYWYGRRSDWNANTWLNNRSNTPKPEASRDDRGYTVGGPIFIPGKFNSEKRKLFFFWSQEFQSRNDPVAERLSRVPTALERRGDFSQSVDNNGNPFPYIRDYTTGLPCSAANTSGCFSDGGVLGRIPANRLYQPGLNAMNIYPTPNASRGSGLNYASQTPTKNPRREELIRMDFQATDNWRVTGRYHEQKTIRSSPTARPGPVPGATISTPSTRFSRRRARTGWFPRPASSTVPRHSSRVWDGRTIRSTSPSATPTSPGRRPASVHSRCSTRMRCRPTTSPSSTSRRGAWAAVPGSSARIAVPSPTSTPPTTRSPT